MSNEGFARAFGALTGYEPLSWHNRLFKEYFAKNLFPPVIDIPTGLAKTMVMAIWLIARVEHRGSIPTRLIYVVDRRTVVDQATDIAEEFAYLLAPENEVDSKRIAERKPGLVERKAKHAEVLTQLRNGLGDASLAISTLRGQLADNREWSRDPSRPAIIIGTVDLIGSALLFAGYRSSYKRRPLEAGLLGQDSLLVLDEAHLSRPFEKLLGAIERYNVTGGTGAAPVMPMCTICMSATSGNSTESKPAFTLQGEDAKDKTISDRFGAKKTLFLVEKERPIETIVDHADKLATEKPGTRIVIFVRTPKHIADVRKSLEKMNKDYATRIAQLTGTMRGLERDELVTPHTQEDHHERRVMQRFLKPDNNPSQGTCFLLSTSAGEVGFDLNADHMVCDATTIESLIQRLGRVNRRGLGEAQIHLVVEPSKKEKDGKHKKLEGLELAIANTVGLLRDVADVSPKNIAALKSGEWKDKYAAACSPEPGTIELTDILLDNWSMTSITEPMPGRPEVGPWLRGIADDLAQTTIAWRAELDEPGFADLDLNDVEEWLDTHRILTHETLSVPTSVAAKWLTDRWDHLDNKEKSEVGGRQFVVDRSGLKRLTVKEVVDQLARKNTDSIRHADLIVPASFGGIERHVGLLDAATPMKPDDVKDADEPTRKANAKIRLAAPDVADVRGRYREKVETSEDGEAVAKPLVPDAPKATQPNRYSRFSLELESDDDRTIRLVSYVRKNDKPETGAKEQPLEEHVKAVCRRADSIIKSLQLTQNDPVRTALELAADWHDHGKNREFFQRTVGGKRSDGQRPWPNHVMGKSGGKDRGRPARGYRHEFGSLREFADAMNRKVRDEVFDLAMHMIVTHHGRGRPHFPKGGFDPDCEWRSDEIHAESIRRFAKLQREYGWWRLAWLENLLRCADGLASADQDAEDDTADSEGGAA